MTTQSVQNNSIEWSKYGIQALMALVGAAAANAIVYFIASALGAMPETVLVQPAELPITVVPVISASITGAIAGILVYAGLLRWTERPAQIFRIMAVVVLILGIFPTLTLGAPIEMVIALNVMHVVAAVIIVGVLTRVNK